MANVLKMATVQSILSLHAQGRSRRGIALALGVDRETVSRYIRLAAQAAAPDPSGNSKPANAPIEPGRVPLDPKPASPEPNPANSPIEAASPESGIVPPPNPAIAPTGSVPLGRLSNCAPWRDWILAKQAQGLTAARIHQDLRSEPGTEGISYDSVRRFLIRLGGHTPIPFRRMECEPGAEAQIDFGAGARIALPDGKRRKTHVLRVVLSHSRKAYSEACFRQTAEDFLRVLENAFWHFGGVPKTLVVDNLKAAVLRADWFDPDLNPKLQSFAQYYGAVILPTKPRTPRHKGKVERGVGYVQDNGLKARAFASLEEQNQHLLHWETTIADTRIHGTTKRQVDKHFREAEQAALLPLPRERFPFFHEAQRTVSRDGHIEVAKSYYSAPPEYMTRTVWARWDARLVRIFNHRFEQVRMHPRQPPGKFSTHSDDIHPQKISGVERGAAWLLTKISGLGEQTHAWAQTMLKARGIEGVRVLQGLLALGKQHAPEALERACAAALEHQAFRLRTIRQLLKHQPPANLPLPFLEEHPLIRPLSDYGGWIRAAFLSHGGRDHQAPRSLPPDP